MKIGRNDPCPCGSGKKYKRCCEPADRAAQAAQVTQAMQPASTVPATPGGTSNATVHETWSGWGWQRETIRALFKAAVAFYRAAPWRVLVDDQPLAVRAPTDTEWTVVVLGNGGIE